MATYCDGNPKRVLFVYDEEDSGMEYVKTEHTCDLMILVKDGFVCYDWRETDPETGAVEAHYYDEYATMLTDFLDPRVGL